MRFSLLAAALALVSFDALALTGQVVDEFGKPIAGAEVQIVGSRARITTDAQGEFTFDEQSVNELHVKAPGFNHKVLHLHELPAGKVKVTLYKGVLEIVDVVGIPVHASVIESSLPVTVLAGDSLRNQQAATLGDTLEKQVGVHSSYHGKVASTPVIRGLSGPRVKITQNGLDVVDASRVGPDHAVATDAATAEQIEILRGPATLFYGSGAIGGVVNVVDKRVPKDSVTEGHGLISYDSVNEQTLTALSGTTGNQWLGIYADGFWREAEDYHVPRLSEEVHEDHAGDTVANSAEQSRGGTLGASVLLDNGFVGLSVGRLNRDYGVPGHGGHDDAVYAQLAQNRYQLLSELDLQNNVLKAIHTRAGFTDYQHAEIENGDVGTVFTNKTRELRVDLLHREFHHWKGGINLHYKLSDEASIGEEAFAPSSETQTQAIAFIEERHFGDVLIQLGARIEKVSIDAPSWQRAELELHEEHEEGEETAEEHEEHEEHEGEAELLSFNDSFTPLSLSFGAVWEFSPGYNIGFSIARAERAPSAAELLAFGPHIGTGAYEIGAIYELHEEDAEDEGAESEDADHEEHHELHFDIGAGKPELEVSNNIDLSFRKFEGNVGIIANAFYNRVDNYYFQRATGLYAEAGHAHEEEGADSEEEDHSSDLPIYQYAVGDTTLTGFELQGIWQINAQFELSAFADKVSAKLENAGLENNHYLPRTPPMRLGAALNFNYDRLQAEFGVTRYAKQDRLAQFETPTDGYTLVNASVDYTLPLSAGELVFFVKGENLGDEFAQVHTSFLKDEAPRAGRNVSVGVRGVF